MRLDVRSKSELHDDMLPRSTMTLVTLAAATSGMAGCYSTWDLAPQAVFNLNGYRQGNAVTLVSVDKEPVVVTSNTSLTFQRIDGTEKAHRFQTIDILGLQLTGVDDTGNPVAIDLSQTRNVRAKNFSAANTALLTSGILIGGGALIVGTIFIAATAFVIEGRPLRISGHDEPIRAAISIGERTGTKARARHARHHDEQTQLRAFAHWARAASAESASIPAFLALAQDLEKASAPTNLVHSALRAAREEAHHTELCTDRANFHGNNSIHATAPVVPVHTDVNRESLLERLALEAFWDGCVAEGSAAVAARRSTAFVKDPEASLVLQTIAHDEHRHAELSREILAYCVSAGGPSIRTALGESLERKRTAEELTLEKSTSLPTDVANMDEDWLAYMGVPTDSLLHRARIETWEKSMAYVATL